MRPFRIAMVQMNPTVGDVDGNVRRIVGWLREAKKAGADLVAFPELAITGYPPKSRPGGGRRLCRRKRDVGAQGRTADGRAGWPARIVQCRRGDCRRPP